jgi:hypothetical protein
VWTDISMNFVEGLPLSNGYSVVLVVVDWLSKYNHFSALAHPFTVAKVAQVFTANVLKLHGIPSSIVSDRDSVFTSIFWRELFKLQGSSLKMSSSYHPQSDGQTEIVNKSLENYLRCFAQDQPKKWFSWLPWAEFWYNTTWNAAIQMTPFEVVYGVPPHGYYPMFPVLPKCMLWMSYFALGNKFLAFFNIICIRLSNM